MAIWLFLLVALILGFYAAWNVGANDVANSMGTSVGSGALTFRQAALYAAVANFLGASLLGSHVSDTVRKGIVDISSFSSSPELLMYGMLAALAASALWLHLASYFGLPVSTTHSIVGAIIGFGILVHGLGAVEWTKVCGIMTSWLICPLAGGVLAYIMFKLVRWLVLSRPDPFQSARKTAPYLVAMVTVILALSVLKKGLGQLRDSNYELLRHLADLALWEALLLAVIAAGLCGFVAKAFLSKALIRMNNSSLSVKFERTEFIFAGLQVLTACFVAFVHGANDVANAIGPMAAVWEIGRSGLVQAKTTVSTWMLVIGGIAIAIGIGTYGIRVMSTVGKKITEMTPSRGFCAEFGAATTVLVFTLLALPVSTTHAVVGAVVGVGYARGMASLNLGILRRIAGSWVITMPATAILAIILYKVISIVVPYLNDGELLAG